MNLHTHFTHFVYGIFAIPSAAIKTPDVGVIILVKPSPNWNAITIAWRDKSIRSENGAMMGIVIAAFAVADGIRKFIIVWIPYISDNEAICPDSPKPDSIEWRIESIIRPSSRIIMIPAAKPTTSAADIMSFAPLRNSYTILLGDSPIAIPHRIPKARNNADISPIYQPKASTPIIR